MPHSIYKPKASIENLSADEILKLRPKIEYKKAGRTYHYFHHIQYSLPQNTESRIEDKIYELIDETMRNNGATKVFKDRESHEDRDRSVQIMEIQMGNMDGEPLEEDVAEKIFNEVKSAVGSYLSQVRDEKETQANVIDLLTEKQARTEATRRAVNKINPGNNMEKSG